MEYVKANEISFDPRAQMSRMFVDGWYTELRHFRKDKKRLAAAFEHIFLLDKFYLAVEGDKVASMVALTPGKLVPIMLDKKLLRRHLGFLPGTVAYIVLTRFVINHPYPFDITGDVGSFELVATQAEFQGRGIAHDLMKHLIETSDYKSYVLEVVENNAAARALYERKLGFVEFKRVKAPKMSSIGHFLYLRKDKAEGTNT